MPNPVGVGQTAYIGFWLDKVPPTAYQEYGDRWHNFTVTVTKPDGTTQTLGPFTSDAAGGSATTYVPTQLGNYTFVFNFPGETLAGANPSPLVGTQNAIYVGDYFAPSKSPQMSLTVQQEPIALSTNIPLPTGYWQRPIPAMNLDWYTIAGNWLGYTLGSGGGGSGGGYYNILQTSIRTPLHQTPLIYSGQNHIPLEASWEETLAEPNTVATTIQTTCTNPNGVE